MMRCIRLCVIVCLLCVGAKTIAASAGRQQAEALLARHAELSEQLQHSQFHQPLYLNAVESNDANQGDVYAVVDHPFAAVNTSLNDPRHWCDMLILHFNTKSCRASMGNSTTALAVSIGGKHKQALERAYRIDFDYREVATLPDYFQIQLTAKKGPLGTSNYLIALEAVALSDDQTFLHLTYSYEHGFAARTAMKTYLATLGSGKVGFTVVGTRSDGLPEYIRRTRGLMERNTMRYYLAIDAYLDAAGAHPAEQFEQRLQHWFTATERYARQLREMDRDTYLEMKRDEYSRQQAAE